MELTFLQYTENPLGKGNAVFSKRSMYKDMYTSKFDAILLREAGKIQYKLYHDKKNDEWYAHIKIPSEIVPKFYYDTVIKFYTKNNSNRTDSDLKNYLVQFYSNDPSFVFTYAYVFKKNDMFIKDLETRMSKLALKAKPTEKNPFEVPGYVKSIYFAYIFMKLKNLFVKANYGMYGSPYDKKVLVASVEFADKKVADRQEAGETVEKNKKKEKQESQYKEDKKRFSRINPNSKNMKVTATISRTVPIKKSSVNTVKTSKTIKKV